MALWAEEDLCLSGGKSWMITCLYNVITCFSSTSRALLAFLAHPLNDNFCLLPLTDIYFDNFFPRVHPHPLPWCPQLKRSTRREWQSSTRGQRSRCTSAGTGRERRGLNVSWALTQEAGDLTASADPTEHLRGAVTSATSREVLQVKLSRTFVRVPLSTDFKPH